MIDEGTGLDNGALSDDCVICNEGTIPVDVLTPNQNAFQRSSHYSGI
jgi:hypothetical protein